MSYLFISGMAAIAIAVFGASFVALSCLQEAWVGNLIVGWYVFTCIGLAVYFVLPQEPPASRRRARPFVLPWQRFSVSRRNDSLQK